jgi:hypothetical protein
VAVPSTAGRIHGAKERGLVPEGFQLWHTGRDRGDMVIRLLKGHTKPPRVVPPARAAETARVPVADKRVKRPTIDLKPAVASLAVSKGLLPRCRTILQQLTDEALSRGYEVLAGVEKSSLVIVASGEHLPFRLFEEQDTAPAPPPTKAELRRYTWRLPPSTIKVPTGRLALRLDHHYRNRTWAERTRWRLEESAVASTLRRRTRGDREAQVARRPAGARRHPGHSSLPPHRDRVVVLGTVAIAADVPVPTFAVDLVLKVCAQDSAADAAEVELKCGVTDGFVRRRSRVGLRVCRTSLAPSHGIHGGRLPVGRVSSHGTATGSWPFRRERV